MVRLPTSKLTHNLWSICNNLCNVNKMNKPGKNEYSEQSNRIVARLSLREITVWQDSLIKQDTPEERGAPRKCLKHLPAN